ncbi:MAG: helix-turn-helix transcriptional regulator [Chitinophagaceae bacterium]|nr:helix-turn-helix transcriptional regulator [Chitinophagaceae bacterium]
MIDLTDYPKYIYDNLTLKEIQACRNVWFSGIRTKYITIPSGRDSEMFIINFHKGMAYPFVDMPMHELTDYVVDGDVVMSNEILDLRDALLNLKVTKEKFFFAEKHLLKRFASRLIVNPFVTYSVKLIHQFPHRLSINHLSSKVGFSQKHFIDIFKDHVGLTPKSFLKVIRFQKAVTEIEFGKKVNWASIALDAGYYDQAHFINDFRDFSGFTPRQYLNSKSEFINYVAVK